MSSPDRIPSVSPVESTIFGSLFDLTSLRDPQPVTWLSSEPPTLLKTMITYNIDPRSVKMTK